MHLYSRFALFDSLLHDFEAQVLFCEALMDVAKDPAKEDGEETLPWYTICMMILLVTLGSFNFILVKAMYNAYGSKYAFFANQGVNFLYIVYSGVVLYQRKTCTTDITPEMYLFSHWKLLFLAFLDAIGTFLTGMGSAYTPMQFQPILNQTLIPCTMLASFLVLNHRYRWQALCGSVLILGGATLSVGPTLFGSDAIATLKTENYHWYACVIYVFSNVPMACSAVCKERIFRGTKPLDVWYLTFWVSLYQFLVTFLFVPFLAVPFIGGSTEGTPLAELPKQFVDGAKCWLGQELDCQCLAPGELPATAGVSKIDCPLGPPMLLVPLYTLCNFCFNTAGLFMMKHGGAVLSYISYAIILPSTTIAGSAVFKSTVTPFTYGGLVVVMTGFGIYQRFNEVIVDSAKLPILSHMDETEIGMEPSPHRKGSTQPMAIEQSSFQERVIGMGRAHVPLKTGWSGPGKLLSSSYDSLAQTSQFLINDDGRDISHSFA